MHTSHKSQESQKKRHWWHRKDALSVADTNAAVASKAEVQATDHGSDPKPPDCSTPEQDGATHPANTSASAQTAGLSDQESLEDVWSRAYDSLKKRNKDLVDEYEALLTKQDPTNTSNNLGETKVHNVIVQDNPQERKAQMDRIMKDGKLRVDQRKRKYRILGKDRIVEDDVAMAVNFVLGAKDWIGEAVKESPEASLIWAGVSTLLPLLTNPSIASKANSEGYDYVTSRMHFYVEFERLLIPSRQNGRISDGQREAFESHLEDLYEQILEYQLRSILRFYRSRMGNLGKDMFKLEDWEKMVTSIKESERTMDEKSRIIHAALSSKELNGIGISTKELVHMAKKQEEYVMAKDQKECHQLFRLTDTSKTDPRIDGKTGYEEYKSRVEERVDGTCQWFLEQRKFKDWLKADSGVLLVTADPGCGKSVLAKFLVDHELPQYTSELPQSAVICYFFFKDQIQSDIQHALCALLHQLFTQKPSLIRHAMSALGANGKELINIPEKLWEILQTASRDDNAGQVICVLDALDECNESDRRKLTSLLSQHVQLNAGVQSKLKVLITSRPYGSITFGFNRLAKAFPDMRIPGEDESPNIAQEINAVIRHHVRKLEQDRELESGSLDHLLKRLGAIEHRTYLWLYLVFDYLDRHLSKWTEKEIRRKIFDNVPVSFDDAYDKIMSKSKDKDKAMKIFKILLAAYRPLTVGELRIALEIEHTATSMSDLDLELVAQFENNLRDYCGLFVTISEGRVYFLHQTAREYLLLSNIEPTKTIDIVRTDGKPFCHAITMGQAHAVLAECSMTYINFLDWLEDPADVAESSDADDIRQHFTDRNSLVEYASTYWTDHFRKAEEAAVLAMRHDALKLCDAKNEGSLTWHLADESISNAEVRFQDLQPLGVASYFGLYSVLELLLGDNRARPALHDNHNRTPLWWAAHRGHATVVELLLNTYNVDVNFEEGLQRRTLLHHAAAEGHGPVVELLLRRKGTDVNRKDGSGNTPLHLAAIFGRENAARLLIQCAVVDLNATNSYRETPLEMAFRARDMLERRNDSAIIQMLLETGKVQIWPRKTDRSHDNYGQDLLSWAARRGSDGVVKQLVKIGTLQLDWRDRDYGRTALSEAAKNGHKAIVELLLDGGAQEVDSGDKWSDRTALSWAAGNGHEAIVELLLRTGKVDINSRDSRYGKVKARELPSLPRNPKLPVPGYQVVRPHKENNVYDRTPLSWAAGNGHAAIVKRLLATGMADPSLDLKDNMDRTPLDWAMQERHQDVVELLQSYKTNLVNYQLIDSGCTQDEREIAA